MQKVFAPLYYYYLSANLVNMFKRIYPEIFKSIDRLKPLILAPPVVGDVMWKNDNYQNMVFDLFTLFFLFIYFFIQHLSYT